MPRSNEERQAKMKHIHKTCLLWSTVFVWLGTLLFLSFQPGEGTAETSGRLATMVFRMLSALGLETSYAVIHGMLRTVAHIVVFLIFGGLLEAAITETMKVAGRAVGKVEKHAVWKMHGLLIKMLICAGIAILSEVFKIYVPGRHLDWPEVGLNVVGACLGCGGMYVVEWLYKKRRHV